MRLADFITANTAAILRDWEDFARSLGQVASEMDSAALRDHAELILHAVVEDLRTPQTCAQQNAKGKGNAPRRPAHWPPTAATSHGVVRAEEGFSLEQMVSEFRALRASVLRLWAGLKPSVPANRPEAYEELMRFNEAIDEALADSIRTYSHALDQLAVTKARHRMEALGTLSAGLGHDMTNVLAPMRMCLGTLSRRHATPESAPLIEALGQAVAHLEGLTTGLRALSMDPASADAQHSRTVLHEWWGAAISPFTWVLPPGVKLHVHGLGAEQSPPLPPVRVPAHALMQAVFNLV
ncbi:MAG: RsbRD N-terminal domain-containing protein, partial [Phycisphaerales bacterium]|nr:RsbRD N-terminal domain-containing protein [Phycisphaerales bacterium]